MNYEYTDKIFELEKNVLEKNEKEIEQAIQLFVKATEEDKVIHAFGTGHSHMIGIEMFARAGGLANVEAMLDPDASESFGIARSGAVERLCGLADIIYDNYKIEKGDIMVITSNSGRNAVPIEMAMRCRKEGIPTIAITNVAQSASSSSRHPSGKRLYEICDVVIDNCVAFGDGMIDIDGIQTGAGTSIIGMFIANILTTETVRRVKADGKKVYVYQSQNLDGANNEAAFLHFENRIKGL